MPQVNYGDSGRHVLALQLALRRLGYMPDEGDVHGPQTQALVRDFQHRAGIKNSGIVGPKTMTALYEVVSVTGQWGC